MTEFTIKMVIVPKHNKCVNCKKDIPFNSSAEKNADKQSWSVTCGPKNQLDKRNRSNLSDNKKKVYYNVSNQQLVMQ